MALASPRAGPEPGSQGTQSRECRHGGSPSPTRVLSNPPHVDPPAAKVRRRMCDVSVRPIQVCAAGDQFSTQETKHCWNQGSALETKKKGKTEALSSLPQQTPRSQQPHRLCQPSCGISEDHTTDAWIFKTETPQCSRRDRLPPSAQNTRNWGRPPPAPYRVGTQAGRQDTQCVSRMGPGRGQCQPALIDTRLVQTHSRDSCSSSCENRNQRSKAPL